MIKKLLPVLIVLTVLFNFNLPGFAAETKTNPEVITINKTPHSFLMAENNDNVVKDLFSPNDHNLDLLIGVILSVIPGFGVGHFWLGNDADGWSFFKLDLLMLALPFAIALVQVIFNSLNIIKPADTMNTGMNIFSILGLVAWSGTFGIKIWETASVWRFIQETRKNEQGVNKISFSFDRVEYSVFTF